MDLKIGGHIVPVSDSFKLLPPDEQAIVIEKIIADKGIKPEAPEMPETTPIDVAKGVGTGAGVGALMGASGAGLVGFVNDAVQVPMHHIYRGVDALAGVAGYEPELAKRHEASTGGFMGTTAALTKAAENVVGTVVPAPVSRGGKLAQTLTSAGVEALAGGAVFRVAATGQIFGNADDALRAADQAIQAGVKPVAAHAVREMGDNLPLQAGYSVAAAGGSEAAQEVGLPPIVGSLLGLTAAATGHAGVSAATGGVKNVARNLDERFQLSQRAKDEAALAGLTEKAKNPDALRAWAQRAKDAEDAYQVEYAKGPDADPTALKQLDEARRVAHGEIVQGSKPTLYEAAGEDQGVGQLQRDMRTEDRAGYRGAAEARRAEQNQARLEELKRLAGDGTPDDILTELRKQREQIDADTLAVERAAQEGAAAKASEAGTLSTPEAVGEGVRTPVVAKQDVVTEAGNKLYKDIEDQGVTVGTGQLKAAVARAWQDIPEKPLSPRERQIAELVKGYGPRHDFKSLRALRSDLAERIRDKNLSPQEKGRAKVLLQAVDKAMDDGLLKALKEEPTVMQRAVASLDEEARRLAEAWKLPPPPPGRAPPVSTAVEPVDDALTAQYREANQNWAENVKQPYELAPVEAIVERAPTATKFEMTPGGVAEASFLPGNKGAEGIRALKAAGATDNALAEAAALSFADPRRGAMRDGVVDLKGYRRWLTNYAPALRELPPEVASRFGSAASAAAYLEQVIAKRKADLRDFDEGTLGKVLGIPLADLEKSIKAYLETPSKAQALADAVKGTAAEAGLRRLAAEHIISRFTDASDVPKKYALSNWLHDNRGQVAAIFGGDNARRFELLVDDIERSRREMTVGKDPAGPGTAGDIASMSKQAAGYTAAALIAKAFGAKGAAAWAGVKVAVKNLKNAGMQSVEEVLAQALIDPEFARKLLTKAPALKNEKFVRSLGSAIARSSPSIARSTAAGLAYGGPR